MGILAGLYQDTVNIYDSAETLVHSAVKVSVQPPKQGQVNMTIEGPMFLTNPTLLAPTTLTIPDRGLIEIVSSHKWTAGMWFRVDGKASMMEVPPISSAHHWQAGLIEENR